MELTEVSRKNLEQELADIELFGLFEGRKEGEREKGLALEMSERLLTWFPDIPVTVQKTQVKFGTKSGFCWICPCYRKMKGSPQFYVQLSFGVRRKIESPRILAAANPYKDRWTLHMAVSKLEEMDEEVKEWLLEAKEISEGQVKYSAASNRASNLQTSRQREI